MGTRVSANWFNLPNFRFYGVFIAFAARVLLAHFYLSQLGVFGTVYFFNYIHRTLKGRLRALCQCWRCKELLPSFWILEIGRKMHELRPIYLGGCWFTKTSLKTEASLRGDCAIFCCSVMMVCRSKNRLKQKMLTFQRPLNGFLNFWNRPLNNQIRGNSPLKGDCVICVCCAFVFMVRKKFLYNISGI